jgi:hypothetical protein
MAGLDKEEALALVDAVKSVALRLGSTRWLNLFTGLLFLGWMGSASIIEVRLCVQLGAVLVLLTGISFHLRPHIDRTPNI